MIKELNTYLHFADTLIRRLSQRVFELYDSDQDLHVNYKTRTNLVTDIDCWVEETITQEIKSKFPDHHVIGEESAEELVTNSGKSLGEMCSSGYCWVVDPLDGTTNFVNSIPIFAISIALFIDGHRTLGLVYDVSRKEMFSAMKGYGAFLNGKKISVGPKTEMLDAVVGLGYPHTSIDDWGSFRDVYEMFLKETRAIRRFGSSTVEQCWVACGRLDGVFESFMRPWDVAAGSLIIEEAGGIVKNCECLSSAEFNVFSNSYVAANKMLFPEFYRLSLDALEILKSKP
ncbi:MAG: inositol monophosphatase [Deltaproteobacteria bacterium]|nr:inositol monophosphatase [Deltaproteobacteria bacterium]